VRFAGPNLQIAFADGEKSWLMNTTWDGNSSREVNADEVGDKAVFCLAGRGFRTTGVNETISYKSVKPLSGYALSVISVPRSAVLRSTSPSSFPFLINDLAATMNPWVKTSGFNSSNS
jgi:hypothetical protein